MLCFWVLGASFSRFWCLVLLSSFPSASFLKLQCTKVFQRFLHTLEDGWACARCMSCTTYHKVIPFLYRNARTFWSSCQRHWEKLNLSKARKSHLRKVKIPSPILSSPLTTASTETVSGENSAGCPTAPSRKQPEPGPPATCPAPLAERQKSNAVTHSGRCIHPPSYLQDFVQT